MDRHEESWTFILGWLARRLSKENAFNIPDVIYIEAPLNVGAKGAKTSPHTTIRLVGLYAVAAAAVGNKARVALRRGKVNQVRKHFLGHGTLEGNVAKKRAKRMCQLLGWDAKNYDEADAAALWSYGCAQWAPKLSHAITPIMQERVITEITRVDAAEALFKRT